MTALAVASGVARIGVPEAPAPLRLVTRPRPGARVLRRRRTAVALVGLLSAAGVVQVAHLGATLLGGGPLTAPEEQISVPVAAHVYVVRPGDTLWSIAEKVDPGQDPRPVVEQLAAEIGGSGLVPGQPIRVP